MKRHPVSRSDRPVSRGETAPASLLPTLDHLATAAGLPRLLELAVSGRTDTSLRICRGPTWTNVAQRALHLLHAVVTDLREETPPDALRRILDMRAIGVNWVYGADDSAEGHALFNFGTFTFDTSELRKQASELLERSRRASVPPRLPLGPRGGASLATRMRRRPSAPPEPVVDREPSARLQLDDIIEEHQEAVRRQPTDPEPYRALYKLYVHRDEIDRAWCTCQVLTLLGKARDSERQFFEDHRPKSLLPIKSRLDAVLWKKNLYHQDQNLDVAHVFEVLAPAALKLKMHLLREANQLSVMDERFKQDPNGSTVTLVKTFTWAADVFGIRCPELYVRSDLPGALVAVPMRPPSSLAGSTVCSGLQPQQLAFVVGKHMSSYRGEHYVRCLFPDPSDLAALFNAALEVVGIEAPASSARADEFREVLATCVGPDRMGTLRQAVHRWVQGRSRADFGRWSQAVELTACHAGLLLSGDLGAAWAMINAEPQAMGDLPAEEKVKDLFAFAVSPDYFALRALLGITVS